MKCCASVRAAECHCGSCHQTFSGLGLFDKHQRRNYSKRPAVSCVAPVRLGLVQNARGVWHTPEGLRKRQITTAAMARGRSARAAGMGVPDAVHTVLP